MLATASAQVCVPLGHSSLYLVKAVMAMYEGAQTVVRTTEGDSKACNVK